jgi:hypothetical protein
LFPGTHDYLRSDCQRTGHEWWAAVYDGYPGEDQVQAILSGKTTPADAIQAAQKNADELLRPYVEETALKRLA